ncbi:MAG: hypothetical protein MUD08_18455 [Cytophagales bacterium]|nr:hypothetical protein [Cytophagales bacterium]
MTGYVVTQQKDTLKGYIDDRNWDRNPKVVRFRKTPTGETTEYTPLDIAGFHLVSNSEYYESYIGKVNKPVTSMGELIEVSRDYEFFQRDFNVLDTVFLLVLTRGDISAYSYRDRSEREHFFVRKDTSSITELLYQKYYVDIKGQRMLRTIEEYKNQLAIYMADCPSIAKNASKTTYGQNSITKLIASYAACRNTSVGYTTQKRRVKGEISLVGGIATTHLSVNSISSSIDYGRYIGPVAGVAFNFVYPRGRDAWSIGTEILWKNHSHSRNVNTPMGTARREFSADYARLNLIARYTLPTKSQKIRPFVNIGFSNSIALRLQGNPISGNRSEKMQRHEQGYFIGGGLRVARFVGELRHERSTGMSPFPSIATPVRTWQLLLSYRFN